MRHLNKNLERVARITSRKIGKPNNLGARKPKGLNRIAKISNGY